MGVLSEEPIGGAVCVTLSQRQPIACALSAVCAVRRDGKTPGCRTQGCNASTHGDERKSAARVDRDAVGSEQFHERAGIPRGEIDTADAVVADVLGNTPREQLQAGGRVVRLVGTGGCALCGIVRRGFAGWARTVTSAKLPLGSIAMPKGRSNRALVPRPSLKPWVLPASVVVFPVGMSTRRTRWFEKSCKLGAGNKIEQGINRVACSVVRLSGGGGAA